MELVRLKIVLSAGVDDMPTNQPGNLDQEIRGWPAVLGWWEAGRESWAGWLPVVSSAPLACWWHRSLLEAAGRKLRNLPFMI
jgi:hypothetical protein